MKYLVSAAEMRRYDNNTIEKIGIPALVLMERAALAVVERIKAHCEGMPGRRKVLILAGMGNNGGDALAVARLLAEEGALWTTKEPGTVAALGTVEAFGQNGVCWQVEVWCVGDEKKASAQWASQRAILEHYPVTFVEEPSWSEYTVLVDGLFGVGLSRKVEGDFARAIENFNRLAGYKISLDLPSGIDSDTGRVWGTAVKAEETVTFGFAKRGLVLYPGCGYAGEVFTANIGISPLSFLGERPEMFAYDEAVEELLPKREDAGNKGTFGKVLLVAGSKGMAGAAILSAGGAYRAGAGMVKVLTCEENRNIIQQAVPEALFGTYENLTQSIAWADVLAIGPGLGKSAEALEVLKVLLEESDKPLILDADGLNLLSEHFALQSLLAESGATGRKIILTPHVGELARLAASVFDDREITAAYCKEHLHQVAGALAARLHAVVVAKDARTFISGENRPVCVNLSGNSGLATAGSGDVLAGIIAGLLAQGMDAFEGACVGTYIHGRAGEAAAERYGEHGCMAGDITAVWF